MRLRLVPCLRPMTISRKISNAYECLETEGVEMLLARIDSSFVDTTNLRFVRYYWGFDRTPYDPKLVWIDPAEIRYNQDGFPFPVRGEQAIVGIGSGDWDRQRVPFEETELYLSMKGRYVDGVGWEQTGYYQSCVERIQRGELAWNLFSSVSDIRDHCKKLDRIYDEMRTNGYKTQKELSEQGPEAADHFTRQIGDYVVPDEVRIAFGRNGEVIRTASGRHRVCLAKLLDIDRIPAVVQLQHQKWDHHLASVYESIEPPYLYGSVSDNSTSGRNERPIARRPA